MSQRKYKKQSDGTFKRRICVPGLFTRKEYRKWNKRARILGYKDVRDLIRQHIEECVLDAFEIIFDEIENEMQWEQDWEESIGNDEDYDVWEGDE